MKMEKLPFPWKSHLYGKRENIQRWEIIIEVSTGNFPPSCPAASLMLETNKKKTNNKNTIFFCW